MLYQVTLDHIGRLGITKRDVGKWCVLVQGCTHLFRKYDDAKECYDFIRN